MVEVQLDLTPAQKRKIKNGHTVQLKHNQLMKGDVSVVLDKEHARRIRRALKNKSGMRLSPSQEMYQQMIQGEGFKSVMKKIGRQLKNIGKKQGARLLDKGVDILQKSVEDKLIEQLGPENEEIIKKLSDTTRDKLTDSANKKISNVEAELDTVLQGSGMVKNLHYKYTGRGMSRKVVLTTEGKGAKSFFKKLGRSAQKVFTSKPVREIAKTLVKQGVASIGTALTGNPMIGQVASELTSGLTNTAVDSGMDAIQGAGNFQKPNRRVPPFAIKIIPNQSNELGGALFPPGAMVRGRGRPRKYYL